MESDSEEDDNNIICLINIHYDTGGRQLHSMESREAGMLLTRASKNQFEQVFCYR